MKVCTKCGVEKPFEAFHKNKKTRDGYNCYCKDCIRLRRLELKKNPLMQLEKQIRSSIMLENKILLREGKKLCLRCKNIFNIVDMSFDVICYHCKREQEQIYSSTENGKSVKRKQRKKYYNSNKNIIVEKAKENYKKNKEKMKEKAKEYREKNKEKIKEHREKNKEKYIEYQRQYRLKKKLEKPQNNDTQI